MPNISLPLRGNRKRKHDDDNNDQSSLLSLVPGVFRRGSAIVRRAVKLAGNQLRESALGIYPSHQLQLISNAAIGSNNPLQRIDGGIYSLPIPLFSSIAEYLALPSRILFAVAMTSSNSTIAANVFLPSSDENDASSPSSSSSLDTLDFSTIERDVAAKLTDDDIFASLICINAQSTLKKLILTGCTNITGSGLTPLHASSVLEMIDLSLVGKFQNPKSIEKKEGKGVAALSEEIVIPILQSIVDNAADGHCSLRHVNLLETWRDVHPRTEENQIIGHFIETYSDHLNRSSHRCSHEDCDEIVEYGRSWDPINQMEPWFYGHCQHNTCNQCGDIFCELCECEVGWCNLCERAYCQKCVPSSHCELYMRCTSGSYGCACSGCLQTITCRSCNFECCTECNTVEEKISSRSRSGRKPKSGKAVRVWQRFITCDKCGESVCREGCSEHEGFESCANCNRVLCYSCCGQSCCADYDYECFRSMCYDCHPKGWKCMWCDYDDFEDFWRHRKGQHCAHCYKDSNTRCSICRKKKLFDEDYKPPPIPKSYWVNRGFDEAYAKEMEGFLSKMKVITLQLASGDPLQYDESFSLRWRKEVVLQHDDILLPHWEALINALRQYNHEPTEYSDRILYAHNVRLHPSVMYKLAPILRMKGFTLKLEDDYEREG